MTESVDGCPRILIVDDDRDFRENLSRALIMQGGFEVNTAGDGFEAGYLFARTRPHVVILDVVMNGMGGLDICRKIRRMSREQGPRIIVLTAYPGKETGERTLLHGADLLLTKPQDVQQLILHIEDLLGD